MIATEPAVLDVELPYPPAALSPNARVHWGELAAAKATYKASAYTLARAARNIAMDLHGTTFPLKAPVTMIVTFVVPTNANHDWVNLYSSIKAGEDGIVAAGIIEDDNTKVVQRLGLEMEVAPNKKKACVRVRLVGS